MNKVYVVEMEDGSKWGIPVGDIAAYRANYYSRKNGTDFATLLQETVALFNGDEYEIEDWAANNMNWVDVEDVVECVQFAEVDMQEGWVNGEKSLRDIDA